MQGSPADELTKITTAVAAVLVAALLNLSAQLAVRHCPASEAFYQRKRAEGKNHKQAILALPERAVGTHPRRPHLPTEPSTTRSSLTWDFAAL
ncbi:hypothetical protein ACGFNU_50535 [Spirillospora sp. NPDC048911]|uniref:hypothetical protein n=1 Tax=Spirillospora sp. NPDC048911 TaxID=3364527 RepID=UPI003721474F